MLKTSPNKPKIVLLDINRDIPRMMYDVWQVAKTNDPFDNVHSQNFDNIKELDSILSTDLPTQEFINTVWMIEGMPRAFWDQFDRCRLAAFWQQSIRILDLKEFASKKQYWVPDAINQSDEASKKYRMAMKQAQHTYEELCRLGIPTEDARGVIPLHVNVRGTCAINLRALRGLMGSRACFISQGSYWLPIIKGMMSELKAHLPEKTFKSMLRLPCYGKSFCPIESNVLPRLTNEDPNPVCPLYLERFCKDKEEATAFTKAKHPHYEQIKGDYFDFLRTAGLDN